MLIIRDTALRGKREVTLDKALQTTMACPWGDAGELELIKARLANVQDILRTLIIILDESDHFNKATLMNLLSSRFEVIDAP